VGEKERDSGARATQKGRGAGKGERGSEGGVFAAGWLQSASDGEGRLGRKELTGGPDLSVGEKERGGRGWTAGPGPKREGGAGEV
jgi:hypothetical protein